MPHTDQKPSGIGCALTIGLAVVAVSVQQCLQHSYSSSPLTKLRDDAKDELSLRVLTDLPGHVDQEVAVRGELRFNRTEKPSHWFSTPDGLNYVSKSEDGTLIRSYYSLHDHDHIERVTVRIDEYQYGGLISFAKHTDYSGQYDLVGTIRWIDGQYVLVVDHVPPVKIPAP